MVKRLFFSLLFLQGAIGVYSQPSIQISDFENSVVASYIDHFSTSQEYVYTHFNKSSYISGDAIWFKCYVFNPTSKLLSTTTSNLIVELYDPEGRLVEQKVLFVDKGVADNVFFLGLKSPSGKYTFRAYTNWMKNFFTPDDFTSYITVDGNQQRDVLPPTSKYDVQLLPESGTMLDGITNKIAIKALDPNGNGAKLYGDIIDEKDSIIQSFELNNLGMGNVLLNVTSGTKYSCRVNLSGGGSALYPVPEVSEKGVVIQVDQTKSNVVINLVSNEKTLEKDCPLYLIVHNNGLVQLAASATLSSAKKQQVIKFDKSELINGVNCITLFNQDFKPIAERLVYNSSQNIKGSIKVEKVLKNDSLQLKLKTTNSTGVDVASNLSLSVLPNGTISNNFTTSLLAEVLLSSGLKGHVENPNYYFENQDSFRIADLDNLMLTQGWRKYNWPEILNNDPKKLKYSNEKGFTIQGVVRNWSDHKSNQEKQVELVSDSSDFSDIVVFDSVGNVSFRAIPDDFRKRLAKEKSQISMVSFDTGIYDLTDIDSMGQFSFNNMFLPDKANVGIFVLNRKGIDSGKKVFCTVLPNYSADSTIEKIPEYAVLIEDANQPISIISGNILIEEVRVVGQRQKKEAFTNNIYSSIDSKTIEIDEKQYHKYKRVEDLLRQRFGVRANKINGKWSINMGRGEVSINLKGSPILIVDGIQVGDLDYLFEILSMSDIELISVNKTGFGLGVRGAYGAIVVKTRTVPLSDSQGWKRPTNTLTLKGYSKPIEYYTPKYEVLPPDPLFYRHATVYWQPNVITNNEGEGDVKFKVPSGLDSVIVRVEGISDDGLIFLENAKIEL